MRAKARARINRTLAIRAGDPGHSASRDQGITFAGGTSSPGCPARQPRDTAESARLWHAGWRANPASARVVLGFMLASRAAVDDRYAELTATPSGAPGMRSWPIPTATTLA